MSFSKYELMTSICAAARSIHLFCVAIQTPLVLSTALPPIPSDNSFKTLIIRDLSLRNPKKKVSLVITQREEQPLQYT